jgi:hypothetical protein
MDRGEPQSRDDEPQDPERTSGIMRMPSVPSEHEREALASVKKYLFDETRSVPGEREKTPAEAEIVNAIIDRLPEVISRYGGKPVNLRVDHLHVFDYDKLTDEEKRNFGNAPGRFSSNNQVALVRVKSEKYSIMKFAEVAVHELIHFNSFQSAGFIEIDEKTRKLSERVVGFSMTVEGDEQAKEPDYYFHEVNEAVTAELTKRFCEEYFGSIPALVEDVTKRDKFRAGIRKGDPTEIMAFSNTQESDGKWHAIAEDYPYADERKNGWAMMTEIQEKNPDKFKDAEEVFRLFVNAYFTGNFLTVARLVEKTYGKGFFRRLGKNTKAK